MRLNSAFSSALVSVIFLTSPVMAQSTDSPPKHAPALPSEVLVMYHKFKVPDVAGVLDNRRRFVETADGVYDLWPGLHYQNLKAYVSRSSATAAVDTPMGRKPTEKEQEQARRWRDYKQQVQNEAEKIVDEWGGTLDYENTLPFKIVWGKVSQSVPEGVIMYSKSNPFFVRGDFNVADGQELSVAVGKTTSFYEYVSVMGANKKIVAYEVYPIQKATFPTVKQIVAPLNTSLPQVDWAKFEEVVVKNQGQSFFR